MMGWGNMEWINTNKDWFFSGAGIFIINSIVGIISIIGTVVVKSYVEKKKNKKLNINFELKKISLPETDEINQLSQNLNVSYNNKEYKNLCYIIIDIKNTGLVAIENQSILINFPDETIFIEKYEKFCNSTIKIISETEDSYENNIEIVKKINRLESNDNLRFTYLVDASDSERINVQPRGVDDINYSGNNLYKSEMDIYQKFLMIIVLYIFVDSIPIIGRYLKVFVIIFNSYTITSIIMKLFNSKKIGPQNIMIQNNDDPKIKIVNN